MKGREGDVPELVMLEHSIEIEAPADHAWAIVADLGSYDSWNPFIVAAGGDTNPGGRLQITIRAGQRRPRTFTPTVIDVQPGASIRWRGRLLVPGFFDGEHELRVDPISDHRSRFTQQEKFSGILVPLLGGLLADTERGFAEMNAALKHRVEGRGKAS
ncbi:MAG TPA: SRPBCC domain-containing protein [Acidimicrobiia bacterium]